MIFCKYEFTIELKEDAELPWYKGSTFRGVMGHALKRVVCALRNQECVQCVLRNNCTYALVFETVHAVPLPKGSRVSAPPHPMVLEPPLTTRCKFSKGERLTCTLLLFGEINANLAYFIYAFDQMGEMGIGKKVTDGERAGFKLISVTASHGENENFLIYDAQDQKIRHQPHGIPFSYDSFTPGFSQESFTPGTDGDSTVGEELKYNQKSPWTNKSVTGRNLAIDIVTPLRIISRDAPVAHLPFSVLMRSIIRRNTALLNVYGYGEPGLDYPAMIEAARDVTVIENNLKWLDWKRYSSRHDKKMLMGGLTGRVIYEGDFTPFIAMLNMAEAVHAGKNTTFGLGKIRHMDCSIDNMNNGHALAGTTNNESK
ncbi:MAG: CRISPR system precrRNA processing endoribonuclease RAMP protein Cas6 [Desulfamplus sp.]|nr:CRISPR system precrRNA processing endoribonuclease RAMP protein Cas6 [Desulfamplus sp.]